MTKENRILYNVGGYKYSVSDVMKIYQECKAEIDEGNRDNLDFWYKFFRIEPKNNFSQSMSEILEVLSKRIAIIARSSDVQNIKREVRKCRRKFYYWNDLPMCIYSINEALDNYCTQRRFKDDIKIDKKYYDCWIANACYSVLLIQEIVSDEKIEEGKIYLHKLDWEYVKALKHFSGTYMIGFDLEINIDDVFYNIYDRIRKYHPVLFYEQICEELYKRFDKTEKRIRINNAENVELPTLLMYSIRALSENNKDEDIEMISRKTTYATEQNVFQQILVDARHAITLLDVNNEHDMEFLLPGDESDYLERIMNYSAVYDIHQYVPEGMLFLIRRIMNAHSEKIKTDFGFDAEELYDVICKLVRTAQSDFENGKVPQIPFESVSGNEQKILELMGAEDFVNKDFYIPTQWDKVYSDSEWIIKKNNAYYVIPPIVSMLGVYDKIGKALKWADFGPQLEEAVLDLFGGIAGLKEYSGKYIFENQVCECDAIIMGEEYALIIECKRKGISRKARGGDDSNLIKDIAETYFSSQSQAYRIQRAIEINEKKMSFYPSKYFISINERQNLIYDKDKTTADFSNVKHFIRISCTCGSFWIAGEGGISNHIENHIKEYKVDGDGTQKYIDKFISERDKLLALKACEHEKKVIRLDKMFLSFDRLYDMVMKSKHLTEGGDALIEDIWKLTRLQSKKNDSFNHLAQFMKLNAE